MPAVVGRIDELTGDPKASFLERAQRRDVRGVRIRETVGRSRTRERHLVNELTQHLRAQPLSRELGIRDQKIDTNCARLRGDRRFPLGIVRDHVRLDESNRTPFTENDVMVGGVCAVDRGAVVVGYLSDGRVVAPPLVDMRPLQPLVE